MQIRLVDALVALFRERIGARIALGLACGLLFSFVVAGISIYYLASVGQSLRDMAERDRLLSSGIMRLAKAVEQQSDGIHGFLLSGDSGHLESYAAGHRELQGALADLEFLVPPGPPQLLLEAVASQHGRFEEAAQRNLALYKEGGTRSAALIWQAEGLQVKSQLAEAIDALAAQQEQAVRAGLNDSRSQQWIAMAVALVLVALATALGILVGLHLTRSITTRIQALVLAAEAIKGGDMDTPIPVEGEDELGSMAEALARMIANLRKSRFSLERLLVQTERRNRELLTLNAVAATVSGSLNLQEILDNTVAKTVEMMDGDAGEIALLSDEQCLRSTAAQGLETPALERGAVRAPSAGPAGLAMDSGAAIVIHDLSAQRHFREDPFTVAGFRALVCARLAARDRTLGTISLASRTPGRFDQADGSLLAVVGQQVAVAIENARLYERSTEFAAVAERNRLAREIHDTLAQGLTGIILQLEAADQLIDANLERARFRVRKALELTRESLAEARRSVWNLRPAPLEDQTLAEAIQREAARFTESSGIPVQVEVAGESRGLAREVENGLFRIAQEALTNVRKHAGATAVMLRLEIRDQGATLAISDDGRGFDGSADRPASDRGFGLVSIQERASLLGGQLRVQSAPGEGTTIYAAVPFPRGRSRSASPQDAGNS